MSFDRAKHDLARGDMYPYDAPDDWRLGEGAAAIPASNWAHRAARGILADLNDRAGIKHALSGGDEKIRKEIVESLAAIILAAAAEEGEVPSNV
jgi:hypothetical protein